MYDAFRKEDFICRAIIFVMAKDHMVISLFKGIERRMHAKDTQLASSTHTRIGRAEIIGEL